MNSDLVIDVRGVTKKFGERTVVNDIAMQVRPGEIYGFLGPNGSGKTTFLRMLCGLLKADGGEGSCLGFDFRTQSAEIKKHVGYMTQRFSFYEDLSIEENLDFIARLYEIPQRQAAVEKSLERLAWWHERKQLAGTLSAAGNNGSRSPVPDHDRKLLLLDEPTAAWTQKRAANSGTNPPARRRWPDRAHHHHYMDEAERCHRLAYIAYGNLLASGAVDEVVKTATPHDVGSHGDQSFRARRKIRGLPGVEQVVAFGTALHVSGRDAVKLRASVSPWMTGDYHWTQIQSGLEDVFISLMDLRRIISREIAHLQLAAVFARWSARNSSKCAVIA